MPDKATTASATGAATPDLATRVSNMIEKAQNYEADTAISREALEGWLSDAVAPMLKGLWTEYEGMRKNRDNLRRYLADRTEERDNAQDERDAAEVRAKRARDVMQAVIDHAIRPPAVLERTLKVPPAKREAHEAAELALWHQSCLANAVRFVAELATMTEIECEFLDGHELRSIAQLLQVPDDNGERAPTVPRLYSDEDRDRAIARLKGRDGLHRSTVEYYIGECVDIVAETLGMRRAGA